MKKSRVYTKTGDKGDTGLVSGSRISKADPRIDLYGDLDDFNSHLGFAASLIAQDKSLASIVEFIHHIQSVVFDLGSNLACEPEKRASYNLPQVTEAFVIEIENAIDHLEQDLPALKHFILPGGSMAAAAVHVARTSARSVERKLVGFAEDKKEELPANALTFMNRTSDYLFVLARYVNHAQGDNEISWIPRK